MSTTGRENHRLPRIFKGRRERTGHHKKCGALPDMEPYLRTIRFQVHLDTCYLLVVLERSKTVAKGLC